LALSAAFGTACVPAHALDLLQAVQAAAAIDPVVASVRAQADAVRERVPQALAGLRPTLNATAGGSFGYIDTNVAQPRTFDAQSIGLLATVPVYRPANREAWLQSQSNVEIAELQVEQARQDLILRVATAYFDVLSAQDSLAVVNAQARAFTEQYESARRNFEVGTATITDQQEAQSRLDLTRAQEASIRNDLDVKRALLAQLIGRPVDELHTLRQDLSVTTSDLAKEGEWAAVARDKSYAVRQAELAAEVAKREIDRQRFGHYPTFDITSQVNTNRNANAQTSAALIGQRSQFANIGVQLALPLYAGGAIDARVREAIGLRP
jgi:outer membrane protein